jgi:hypothetical protein
MREDWQERLDRIGQPHQRVGGAFAVALPLHTFSNDAARTEQRVDKPATVRWVRLDCFQVGHR